MIWRELKSKIQNKVLLLGLVACLMIGLYYFFPDRVNHQLTTTKIEADEAEWAFKDRSTQRGVDMRLYDSDCDKLYFGDSDLIFFGNDDDDIVFLGD